METNIYGGKRSKGWGGWVMLKQSNIECQDDISLVHTLIQRLKLKLNQIKPKAAGTTQELPVLMEKKNDVMDLT